ncbi:MAG: hypothetical protein ACLUOI_33830, partial [Eisenbergiella sp.]
LEFIPAAVYLSACLADLLLFGKAQGLDRLPLFLPLIDILFPEFEKLIFQPLFLPGLLLYLPDIEEPFKISVRTAFQLLKPQEPDAFLLKLLLRFFLCTARSISSSSRRILFFTLAFPI